MLKFAAVSLGLAAIGWVVASLVAGALPGYHGGRVGF